MFKKALNAVESRLFPYWVKMSKYIKSDALWLKVYYRLRMHEWLDLKNPQTYTQKLQYLKMHNANPLYTQMVDKYGVRDIVRNKIGEQYLIPLYGVWNNFDSIDFSVLPNEFVLKTTHDSGTVIVCRDKSTFDFEKAKIKLESSLARNYFYLSRETPYKNVSPKIIAEKYMKTKEGKDLTDYKFYCFDGIPKYMSISSGRFEDNHYYDFFDMAFHHLDINVQSNSPVSIEKPENFELLRQLASELSQGIIHTRVDFYDINGHVYFGEYTFHDCGGCRCFQPIMWNNIFGENINLIR